MRAFELVELEQGTPEWLDFRKNHIGASDAPVIMNESPWKTPRKLWQEKLGLIEGQGSNASMRRGIELEPKARDKYMEMTGFDVKPAVAKSLEYRFMMASFDGVTQDMQNIVEIKCPGADDHAMAKQNRVPQKYMYQLVQQMLVLKVDHIHYFSYRNDEDVALVVVNLEDVKDYAKNLIPQEKKFWECVRNFDEPALVARDFVEKNDAMWNERVNQYITVKNQLKELEAQEKEFKDSLILMANGENCQGSGLKLSKFSRRGVVDYAAVPELIGIDLNPYRKASTNGWVVNIDKTRV